MFQFLLLPLVFSLIHLGALSLASLAHRAESGSHPSRPRWRPGISCHHGPAFVPLAVAHGALLAGTSPTVSSSSTPRCRSSRPRSPSWSSSCCASSSAPCCSSHHSLLRRSGQAFASSARWPSATRASSMPSGSAVVRRRRAVGGQRRHPVPRRSGKQLRGSADHALAPITTAVHPPVAGATLLPVVPLALTMMPLEELLKKLLGVPLEQSPREPWSSDPRCTQRLPASLGDAHIGGIVGRRDLGVGLLHSP